MFVVERGEGDGREPSALQPVHHCGVDGHSLFRSDIGTILGRGGAEGEGQGNGQAGEGWEGCKKRSSRGEKGRSTRKKAEGTLL